jgi:hypothetical protein
MEIDRPRRSLPKRSSCRPCRSRRPPIGTDESAVEGRRSDNPDTPCDRGRNAELPESAVTSPVTFRLAVERGGHQRVPARRPVAPSVNTRVAGVFKQAMRLVGRCDRAPTNLRPAARAVAACRKSTPGRRQRAARCVSCIVVQTKRDFGPRRLSAFRQLPEFLAARQTDEKVAALEPCWLSQFR